MTCAHLRAMYPPVQLARYRALNLPSRHLCVSTSSQNKLVTKRQPCAKWDAVASLAKPWAKARPRATSAKWGLHPTNRLMRKHRDVPSTDESDRNKERNTTLTLATRGMIVRAAFPKSGDGSLTCFRRYVMYSHLCALSGARI
jgi:hypothetical protein